MSSFWSGWIIVLTTITLVLTTWILFANRKKTGDQPTTGHIYDGIEEYDNPLPAWWLWMFVGTIVFGVGYLIAYPGMGNFPGVLGWTSTGKYEAEIEKAEAKYGAIYAQFAALPAEQLAADPAAMTMARRIFSNNCAQCHGSDARGAFGFPNLADHDWLYGGETAQIKHSITDGRKAAMPPWEAVLNDQQLTAVTQYVAHLGDEEGHIDELGKQTFGTYCVACHGQEGQGNVFMGAPNLADDVWLYGGDISQIKLSVAKGRNGAMPAHKDMLSEDKIHLLTAYVFSLSQQG